MDFDLWLLRKNVCYSLPTSYLPDSPNDSLTYFSLGETSSVEVPLCIGGNPAFPSITPPAVLLALMFLSPFLRLPYCHVLSTKRSFGPESTISSFLPLLHKVGSLI